MSKCTKPYIYLCDKKTTLLQRRGNAKAVSLIQHTTFSVTESVAKKAFWCQEPTSVNDPITAALQLSSDPFLSFLTHLEERSVAVQRGAPRNTPCLSPSKFRWLSSTKSSPWHHMYILLSIQKLCFHSTNSFNWKFLLFQFLRKC